MFWKFSYSASQIQTILEKPDVTLNEILDEDDVIQECKSNNEKLITFLIQNENLNQLITYVVTLPADDIGERQRFKYSTIASELLTCDIPAISDSIIQNQELIDKLYAFLYNDAPLNPLLASYFARVMGSLISRKTELLLTYLQTKQDFVELLLKHVNTSAVMDVLLRLLTTIENNDLKQRVLKWLTDINLIKNLISLFSSKYTNDVHSNVSQLLCDIIRISREQILAQRENQRDALAYNLTMNNSNSESNQDINMQLANDSASMANPLLDTIEEPEIIDKLLDYMFDSINSENVSLSFGIDVLLTILEPKTSTVEFIFESKNLEADRLFREQERFSIASRGITNVTNSCIPRLKSINELLINKKIQTMETVKMTYGELTPPLGSTKLNVIKLISKLIGTNNVKLNEEIVHFNILNTILDNVFENRWNNFLHTQILNIITNLFTFNNQPSSSNNSSSNNNNQNNNQNEENKVNGGGETMNSENPESPEQLLYRSSLVLLEHLFKECHLIERFLKAWSMYFESSSYDQKNGKKSNNAGYVGHLTQLSNLIIKNTKEGRFSTNLQTYFNDETNKDVAERWKELEENKLAEINKRNTQDLVRNPLISCSTDSNPETDTIDLPSDENMQRKYVDYNKDMIPSFPDSFGLSDINITNYLGKTPDGFPKLQNITFQSFQMEANEENAQLFDQICSQRDSMREAVGESNNNNINDEDVWVSREIKFAETSESENRNKKEAHGLNLSDDDNSSSSSSDEEQTNANQVNNFRNIKSKRTTNIDDVNNTGAGDATTTITTTTIANIATTSGGDMQMEFTNASDFKTNENWADFTQFHNNQGEQVQNSTPNTENTTSSSNESTGGKNNLSNDEDNNWANFENFNELTNERCSSPNSTSSLGNITPVATPTTIITNETLVVTNTDRSNAYIPTAATNKNETDDDKLNKPTTTTTDETPMESTNTIDESNNQKITKELTQKYFKVTRSSASSSLLPSSFVASKITSLFNTASSSSSTNITTTTSAINNNNADDQSELNNNFLFLSSKGLMRSSELLSKNNSRINNNNNNEK